MLTFAVDFGNTNSIEIMITNGTTHNVKVAPELVAKLDLEETEILCADKGYDSEPLREQIRATDTQAKILRKLNTQSNNNHIDWNLYKIRHLVENAFARLKHFSIMFEERVTKYFLKLFLHRIIYTLRLDTQCYSYPLHTPNVSF